MSNVPYSVVDRNQGWRGPEPAYADFNNNGTKDEANAADAVFWPMPVKIGRDNPIIVRSLKRWTRHQTTSVYDKQINHTGYEEVIITMSGPVYNRSLLYYLYDYMVTTDDAPSAGFYTHVFVSTGTRTNPPRSFEIWLKQVNDKSGGGETVYSLIVGCTVISYKERGDVKNNEVIGEYVIHGRREIAGAALNSEPVFPNQDFFNFLSIGSNFSWAKGGAASIGKLMGYEFFFGTDKKLIQSCNYWPISTRAPNKITEYLQIDWLAYETDSFDDSQDDPHTAANKDISLKISVNETNNYFTIAYVDALQQIMGQQTVDDGNLLEKHRFSINPHETTPSTLTTTEVNNIVDDRYET